MKPNRSISEALDAAKRLRNQIPVEGSTSAPSSESLLKVVGPDRQEQAPAAEPSSISRPPVPPVPQPNTQSNSRPVWVRHTLGLRETTSLRLRDAADGQKRKDRYGQLTLGEPANEQEIADLGITLALERLGYLS